MNIRQLDYFMRVAESGSFSKAAARLGIAQPALSRQVRGLEVELRQALLIRNGRGVATTEAGKTLLAHARGILYQIDRAREDMETIRGTPTGRVAVGLPPTIAKLLAAPLVGEFRSQFPQASLSIAVGLSAALQERLRLGEIDVALLYNPITAATVEVAPFLVEELYLVGPASPPGEANPVHAARLPDFPLIIPSRPNTLRMQVENSLAALGIKPTISMELDGVEAILALIKNGHGYAILTGNALRASGNAGSFVARPIVKPRLQSQLALAVASHRPTSPIQEAALSLIRRIGMRELVGWKRLVKKRAPPRGTCNGTSARAKKPVLPTAAGKAR